MSEQLWGFVLAGLALIWRQREVVWRAVAEAMRQAEKAGIGVQLEGERLNKWLEDEAVGFFRRSKWLRWVPEAIVRGIIRELATRHKAAEGGG